MRDQEGFTNRETPECTCTGRLLVGARHSPGPQTNSEAVRPCGQRMGNNICQGGGSTRLTSALVSAVAMVIVGAGFPAQRDWSSLYQNLNLWLHQAQFKITSAACPVKGFLENGAQQSHFMLAALEL